LTLKLVPYESSFAEAFFEWRSQPLSVRHNPLQPLTKAELVQMLESEGSDLSDLKRYATYRWFIAVDDEIVGTVSLKNISHSMGYGEIGYGVAETHHNQGIATAAVRMLVDKVFAETTLRKLIAYVHDQNRASCRVLEKLGFRREGFLREHYIINGKPANEILYGLLRSDWEAARQ
jgi:[ribosomal protein S5]-alanine N-acetyltransferase